MKKASRIILSILLIVAMIVPANLFANAADTIVNTTPARNTTVSREYYNLNQGLYTKKTVSELDNGNYQVALESYTSDVRYLSSDKNQIWDVMCLVDQSNSMLFDNRMSELKSSLKNVMSSFINDYGAGSKLKMNVSIWSFSNACTDLLSKVLDYKELNSSNYKARTSIFKSKNIEDKINDLEAHAIGGTNTGEAMTKMNSVISNRINNTKNDSIQHKQMLLVFTDGAPSVGVSGFDEPVASDYANTALKQAESLKQKGVLIYTIGVGTEFNALNRDVQKSSKALKLIINDNINEDLKRATLFLNMLSTGWRATTLKDYNWRDESSWKSAYNDYVQYLNPQNPESYYYVGGVKDANNLSNYIATSVLYNMSTRLVAQGSLLGDYSLKDTTSKYFEVVPNTTKIYKVPYDSANGAYSGDTGLQHGEGTRAWGTPVDITNQISYAETSNYVEILATAENSKVVDTCVKDDTVTNKAEHSGNKLRVTFEIRPKDSFLGGKSVPSNDYNNSGIFKADSSGGSFIVQSFAGLASDNTLNKTSPTFMVAIPSISCQIADDNVKIGYLYNLDNLGLGKATFYYAGRNDSSNLYSIVKDENDEYYVKNLITSEKVVYNSQSSDDTSSSSASAGPLDFVSIINGETYVDSSRTLNGVVYNNDIIQFNSVGYKLNKSSYSGTIPVLNKHLYVAWSGLSNLNDIISNRFSAFNKTQTDEKATTNAGIAGPTESNPSIPANYYITGYEAIRQVDAGFFVNVFVPNILVSDAISESGMKYSVNSSDLSAAFDSLNVTTTDSQIKSTLNYSMANGTLNDGYLSSLAIAQMNSSATNNFVKLNFIGDVVKIDTTASANAIFVNDIFSLSNSVSVTAYVKSFADAKGNAKSAEDSIEEKDKLQLTLSYNELVSKIDSFPTDAEFKTTFDEFWAVNQCTSCSSNDKITPQFLGYQSQVHVFAPDDTSIVVQKTGCDTNHQNESFVFTVVEFNKDVNGDVDVGSAKVLSTFTIQGNGQSTVVVTDTADKYYCVVEDLDSLNDITSGWTWDYTSGLTINDVQWKSIAENAFTLNSSNGANAILTFNNKYDTSNKKLHYASSYACNTMSNDGGIVEIIP